MADYTLDEEMSKYIGRLKDEHKEILDNVFKSNLKTIDAVGRNSGSETFAGYTHIKNVMHITNLLLANIDFKISSEQLLLLGCAVLLHDIGRNDTNYKHADKSASMIEKDYTKYSLPNDEQFAEAVAYIVRSHGKVDTEINSDIRKDIPLFNHYIRIGICAIILRLADELDCTNDRTHPSMHQNSLIVRSRECTTGLYFLKEKKIIEIHALPKDICVWKHMRNNEKHINAVMKSEIRSDLFNSYEHIKIEIYNEELHRNSFWLKMIELDSYNEIDIDFALGIIGDIPEYGKQDSWRGCPYSIWDITSIFEIMNLVHCINTNAVANIIHVIMDKDIVNNIDKYTEYLKKDNTIILGSPKVNALSEILLSKAFGVKPFSFEENKNAEIVRFGWPEADSRQKTKLNIPLSSFLCNKEKGIYFGSLNDCRLLARTEFPESEIDIKPDCGIIVITSVNGKYHILAAGTSGPGTLASAQSIVNYDTCFLLERKEIMESLDTGYSIIALVTITTSKNDLDIIKDRNIETIGIEKIWRFCGDVFEVFHADGFQECNGNLQYE
jgi:hypothetical protein